MEIKLSDYEWLIKTDVIDQLLMTNDFEIVELDSGMEATVYRIQSYKVNVELVLKLWNKRVPADVMKQYYLLVKLGEAGLSVSKAYALGRNIYGEYGLITSYDGLPMPFGSIEIGNMQAIANHLVRIHSTDITQLIDDIPKYDDFLGYFFSLNGDHADIANLLQNILQDVTLKTNCMIHGDFNLGNVLINNDNYTVIDWTNAQLGDNRYDLAWAIFLILIYNGEDCYRQFYDAYTQKIAIDPKEIYIFEMIACLRWIWLSRIAPIPIHRDTLSRVKGFIENHKEIEKVAFAG